MTNLYSVSYNTNNSTGGTTPPTQTAESNSETYTFVAPSAEQYGLVKTGYFFMGWAESSDATNPQYKSESSIELTRTNPSIALYAVWLNLSPVNNWSELKYMHQMSPSACADGNETGKQLIDVRDGKKYWVARLKDGNCWMTQNLDYDDPGGTKISSTSGENGGPGSDWKDDATIRQYWDPGEKIISGSTLAAATSSTDRHLLVGNYYSWESATNGTGKDVSTDGADASGSICPKGWRLPSDTYSTSTDKGPTYDGLRNAYSIGSTGSKLLNSPLYFLYGGYVNSGTLNYAGSYGFYWSSTAVVGTDAYYLYFESSYVNPSDNAYRYSGMSVRCVAR